MTRDEREEKLKKEMHDYEDSGATLHDWLAETLAEMEERLELLEEAIKRS